MKFLETRPNFALLIELVIVIGAKVVERDAVFENVVNRNQQGVRYREVSAFLAAMSANPRVLRVKIGGFHFCRRMRADQKRRAKQGVTFPGFPGAPLPSALIRPVR